MATFLGSRLVRAALALVLVVVVLAAVRAVRVHEATGEFRLTPSEAPPRLHKAGRDYLRSSSAPRASLPKDVQEIGETSGGGEEFGPRHFSLEGPGSGPTAATVIWVRDDSGRVWTYELVEGP